MNQFYSGFIKEKNYKKKKKKSGYTHQPLIFYTASLCVYNKRVIRASTFHIQSHVEIH